MTYRLCAKCYTMTADQQYPWISFVDGTKTYAPTVCHRCIVLEHGRWKAWWDSVDGTMAEYGWKRGGPCDNITTAK